MLRRVLMFTLRKPLRFFAFGVLAAASLAWLQLALGSFVAERSEPGRGACWIWADGAANAAKPLAFWMVRDLRITDPSDLENASVILAADEAYVLWLNGERLGAGEYTQSMAADRYDVSGLLQLGMNRFVIELRSSRGAGGLLASVRSGDRILLSSDDSWRVIRRADPRILRGSLPLEGAGERVKVWSDSTTGRFRVSGFETANLQRRSWSEPAAREIAFPKRMRHLSKQASWKAVEQPPDRLPARQTVFDFGRRVSGFLDMELAEEGQAGLVFFGDEEPGAQSDRPDLVISPFPGRHHWRDVRARTFRYVALVGLPALRRLEVAIVPEQEAVPAHREAPFRGVFGLPPAQPYLPVEEAVWDRLKHLAARQSSSSDPETADGPAGIERKAQPSAPSVSGTEGDSESSTGS